MKLLGKIICDIDDTCKKCNNQDSPDHVFYKSGYSLLLEPISFERVLFKWFYITYNCFHKALLFIKKI